jgi:hypothetical protein
MSSDLREPGEELLALIAELGGGLPAHYVEGDVSLVQAGEHVVAFENLASQLDDFNVAVSPATAARIVALGRRLRVDRSYWEDWAG